MSRDPPRKKLRIATPIIVEDIESDSDTSDSYESDVSMETLRERLRVGKIREKLMNESTDDSSSDNDDPIDVQSESAGLQHLVDSTESKHKIRDSTLTTSSRTCIKKERETNEQSLSSIQVKQEVQEVGKNEKNTPDLEVGPCYFKTEPQDTVHRHGDQIFASQGSDSIHTDSVQVATLKILAVPDKQQALETLECEPSQIVCNSVKRKDHLNGEKHGEMVALAARGSSYEQTQTEKTTANEGLESACTDLMQEATGQELPTPSHNTQKSSKIIECRPCGRVFFDRASVQVHLNSKKHVENVKKAAAGCLNGQKNADQKRIAGRGSDPTSTDLVQDATVQKEQESSHMKTNTFTPNILKCEVCQVVCRSMSFKQQHLMGKKHRRRVKWLARGHLIDIAMADQMDNAGKGPTPQSAENAKNVTRAPIEKYKTSLSTTCSAPTPLFPPQCNLDTKTSKQTATYIEGIRADISNTALISNDGSWITVGKRSSYEKAAFPWLVKHVKAQDFSLVQDNSVSSSSVETKTEQSVDIYSKEMDTGSWYQITDRNENIGVKTATQLPEKQASSTETASTSENKGGNWKKGKGRNQYNPCPCGFPHRKCKKLKKSKKVFSMKKLQAKNFPKGSTREDLYQVFPKATAIQMKAEATSGRPYALIVFGKQKDCEEALYKNLNKSKMMVKLGLASRNRNRKDEPGVTLHDLKTRKHFTGKLFEQIF